MQYFYFTFRCAHGALGNMALRQHKGINGFNLASAHAYLLQTQNEPCIVENWHEITETRYNEFQKYLEQVNARFAPKASVVPKPCDVVPLRPEQTPPESTV